MGFSVLFFLGFFGVFVFVLFGRASREVSLDHGGSNWSAGVATPFVTLHVTPYTEGLAASCVGATEGLLAGVAVRVDAEAGRTGEGLVAGATDVSVVVLLERSGGGRGEVVMMLPGVGDLRDHLLSRRRLQRSGLRRRALVGTRRSGSLVVYSGRGRRVDGRREGSHAGSGRNIRSMLNGALARDRGPVRGTRQTHLRGRVFRLDGRNRRCGRGVTIAVEARTRSHWRSGWHVGLRAAGNERLADFSLRPDFRLPVQRRGSSLALGCVHCGTVCTF